MKLSINGSGNTYIKQIDISTPEVWMTKTKACWNETQSSGKVKAAKAR